RNSAGDLAVSQQRHGPGKSQRAHAAQQTTRWASMIALASVTRERTRSESTAPRLEAQSLHESVKASQLRRNASSPARCIAVVGHADSRHEHARGTRCEEP